jgi:hypothetical protein
VVVELAQLLGGLLGSGQVGVKAGQVAQLQQVRAAQAEAPQRQRPVPEPLGQVDHFAGGGQPLAGGLEAVHTPDGLVAVQQHRGQGGRVTKAPGQLDGLLAERQAALDLRGKQQRSGQPGQHPRPQPTVGLPQGHQRLFQ